MTAKLGVHFFTHSADFNIGSDLKDSLYTQNKKRATLALKKVPLAYI